MSQLSKLCYFLEGRSGETVILEISIWYHNEF